jgi:hypothetical protein
MIQAARYGEAMQPPAVAMLPAAKNGWFSTSTPASCTHGLVVRSVHAGMAPSRPSFARTSVPEHCAAISWRAASSRSADMTCASATTSRVLTPLPTITASAVTAADSGTCACTTTPFIDVTVGCGQHSETRQPGVLMRFRTPSAISESSSLKPSNVRMAMCMVEAQGFGGFGKVR